MMFFNQSVEKNVQRDRAKAVAKLDKAWMNLPEPDNYNENHKDFKQMYEEAALSAMVESSRRKAEAEIS